ncbi:MAG: hypothetical protein HKM28_06210, partial [Flavobacteriaceae bacterium]|nr:hypothetical protein [Flavobacteriaceae bacterium]
MRLFKKDPWQIIAFQTYGTDTHLYARGRAIEDETIDLAQKGFLNRIVNSFKRFEADELSHTRLRLTLPDGRIFETTTDSKGYYIIDEQIENLASLANEEGFVSYEIEYANPPSTALINFNNRFPGEILIPSKEINFGVASDIDDTILHTGVTSRLKWKLL